MNHRLKSVTAGVVSGVVGSLMLSGTAMAQTSALTTTGPFSGAVPVQQTDYMESIAIPKFDTSLGTLDSVVLTFGGSVEGLAGADNTAASTVDNATLELAADLTLSEPTLGNIFTIKPSGSETFSLGSDEGEVLSDFTGSDGVLFDDINGTASDTVTYSDPGFLSVFSGATDPLFAVDALAASMASGSGNIDQLFRTRAGADLAVTYSYIPVPIVVNPDPPSGGGNSGSQGVPEAPATLSLAAIAALGLLARRQHRS